MKHGGALGQFTSTADEFQQDNINNFSITDEINTRKHSSVFGEGEGEQGGDEISEIVRISTCRKLAERGKNSTSTFACNLVSELWGREAINSLSLRSSSLSFQLSQATHGKERETWENFFLSFLLITRWYMTLRCLVISSQADGGKRASVCTMSVL